MGKIKDLKDELNKRLSEVYAQHGVILSPENEEVLTRPEAADFLRVPQRTVDYLVAVRELPYTRVGKRRVVFLRSRLIEYLKENEKAEFRLPRKKTCTSE
jgi:excisionase family DNA binding protein